MKIGKFAAVILLTATKTLALAAQAYQVELIVFSQITPGALANERWPEISKKTISDYNATPLSAMHSSDLHAVHSSEYRIKKEHHKIQSNPRYKIILHLAWRESLAQLDKKTVIHLYGGGLYDNSGHLLKKVINESLPYSAGENWELDGTLTVQLDRYFNLDFNLLFALPTSTTSELANSESGEMYQPFKYFNIVQSRRTRSQEINYIDHPLYGVLFQVIPV